jgi:dTDP-4-dehydrorhamnose reductase
MSKDSVKIALLGADGQLGTDFARAIAGRRDQYELHALTLNDFDVRNHTTAQAVLKKIRPEIIINTTAYVRVDDAEDHAQEAFDVNAVAVLNLTQICAESKAQLVHFSTDYVFGGEAKRATPYAESDCPAPQSMYAFSKLAGELVARAADPRHLVVRSCGLYGKAGSMGKGTNFVETMLRLADAQKPLRVVNDQRLTPTYTVDLTAKVIELIEAQAAGLFHLANSGECTWFEFAQEIFRLAKRKPDLSPVDSVTFGSRARRPAYSVLRSERLAHLGVSPMQSWQQALKAYLAETGRL